MTIELFLIDRFEELFNTNNLCQHLCQAAMRWSAVRLDSLVIASSCITALLVISFKNEISPAFAGLAMAYATQMTGVFQYTVRLMSETEVRFISVERINYYLKVIYFSLIDNCVYNYLFCDWYFHLNLITCVFFRLCRRKVQAGRSHLNQPMIGLLMAK